MILVGSSLVRLLGFGGLVDGLVFVCVSWFHFFLSLVGYRKQVRATY